MDFLVTIVTIILISIIAAYLLGDIGLIAGTLALVIVTAIYAFQTKILANIAKKQLDKQNKVREMELLEDKLSQSYGPLYTFIKSGGFQLFPGNKYDDEKLKEKILEKGDKYHRVNFEKKILEKVFNYFPYLLN